MAIIKYFICNGIFLQTLVKKKYISQFYMLILQKILMLASTLAAIYVLMYVNIFIAMASLVLNFIYRKHDVLNTMILLLLSYLFLITSYHLKVYI